MFSMERKHRLGSLTVVIIIAGWLMWGIGGRLIGHRDPVPAKKLDRRSLETTPPRDSPHEPAALIATAALDERPIVVIADESFESRKWPATLSTCSSLARIFMSKVANVPPLGYKPIVIRKAEDAKPRVDWRGLPDAYWVNLTAPDSRYFCQIVSESGHEFAHIWIGPRVVDNGFVEAVCTAMGHVALEEMAKEWSLRSPGVRRRLRTGILTIQ